MNISKRFIESTPGRKAYWDDLRKRLDSVFIPSKPAYSDLNKLVNDFTLRCYDLFLDKEQYYKTVDYFRNFPDHIDSFTIQDFELGHFKNAFSETIDWLKQESTLNYFLQLYFVTDPIFFNLLRTLQIPSEDAQLKKTMVEVIRTTLPIWDEPEFNCGLHESVREFVERKLNNNIKTWTEWFPESIFLMDILRISRRTLFTLKGNEYKGEILNEKGCWKIKRSAWKRFLISEKHIGSAIAVETMKDVENKVFALMLHLPKK